MGIEANDEGSNLALEVDEALDRLVDAVSKLDLPPEQVAQLLDMLQVLSDLLEKQAERSPGE